MRIDKVQSSSLLPGFGYEDILTDTMIISGSVPPGGRNYTKTFTVGTEYFIDAYYNSPNSVDYGFPTDAWFPIGGIRNTTVDGVGNNVYNYGTQSGGIYTIRIFVDNASGSSLTVPTQTVNLKVLLSKAPF